MAPEISAEGLKAEKTSTGHGKAVQGALDAPCAAADYPEVGPRLEGQALGVKEESLGGEASKRLEDRVHEHVLFQDGPGARRGEDGV